MTTRLYELRDQLTSLVSWPEEPVVAELPDGGRCHISEVKQVDGVTVLVLGDWYDVDHSCSEGSYGGEEPDPDAPQTRQDAVQDAIVDRAGLSVTSTDRRTVLEAFRDALVDAMAAEMSMLRAPREQWEVAASGVMALMNVRGIPAVLQVGGVKDAVLFTRKDRAELPPVPREAPHDESDGPTVTGASQDDGEDRAPGDAP